MRYWGFYGWKPNLAHQLFILEQFSKSWNLWPFCLRLPNNTCKQKNKFFVALSGYRWTSNVVQSPLSPYRRRRKKCIERSLTLMGETFIKLFKNSPHARTSNVTRQELDVVTTNKFTPPATIIYYCWSTRTTHIHRCFAFGSASCLTAPKIKIKFVHTEEMMIHGLFAEWRCRNEKFLDGARFFAEFFVTWWQGRRQGILRLIFASWSPVP